MTVEVLKDAVVYEITKNDMESVYELSTKTIFFFKNKLEKSFANFQKRILQNYVNTAKERYLKFLEKYPEIEKNVKNYHIASYLGITCESLSRIHNKINY